MFNAGKVVLGAETSELVEIFLDHAWIFEKRIITDVTLIWMVPDLFFIDP